MRFSCFELTLGEFSQAGYGTLRFQAPQDGCEQPCAHSRKGTAPVSCPVHTTSASLSPRHAAVVLQEKKNLVSEVMGEPVVTEPNLCLCHLCRTSPATPVGQEPAAGAFHNMQTFIEGVSSVAAGSASSPSPAWLHLCRGWGGAGKHLYSHQDG